MKLKVDFEFKKKRNLQLQGHLNQYNIVTTKGKELSLFVSIEFNRK